MIILRNLAGGFLKNNGKYLLMKRSPDRKIAPGVWSGIGGHMEPDEINNPVKTFYREIEEEAGIKQSDINSLELLYIIMLRRKDEINQIYVFFGETSQTDVTQTDEGEFFWIPEDELLNREYSKIYAAMLDHYIKRSKNDRAVYVNTIENDGDKLRINWFKCEDFKI